jgi:hypothetical protein
VVNGPRFALFVEQNRAQLLTALESETNVSVVYTDYDWTPNAKV